MQEAGLGEDERKEKKGGERVVRDVKEQQHIDKKRPREQKGELKPLTDTTL